MSAPAAIDGTFVKIEQVATRKVARLHIEVPIEKANAALEALGGFPDPSNPVWVAVARLGPVAQRIERPAPDREAAGSSPAGVAKRRFEDLPPAQQAALACQREAFQRFLTEEFGNKGIGEEAAAAFVRGYCVVQSRSEIGNSDESLRRWNRLYSLFQIWLQDAAA